MIVRTVIAAAALVAAFAGSVRAQGGGNEHPALIAARTHLYAGTLPEGEHRIAALALKDPESVEAVYALGLIRTAVAIERFSQSLTRYGFKTSRIGGYVPLSLPVKPGKDIADITHEDWRRILGDLVTDLDKAEATLAGVGAKAVTFRLEPGKVRFDLNGDGNASDDETLWSVISGAPPGAMPDQAELSMIVTFDSADAAWLRGYANIVIAKAQFLLGYDTASSFPFVKELLFVNPKALLPHDETEGSRRTWEEEFIPVVAFVHSVHWPVGEPARLAEIPERLKTTIVMSRLSWKLIAGRQDKNALRWIPGPGQKGAMGIDVTEEMLASWHLMLDRMESVLDGKILLPIPEWWRSFGLRYSPAMGINLRRMFTEPREFDFVLFSLGYNMQPFVEQGEALSQEEWMSAVRSFGGNFMLYAAWFN